MVEETLQGGGRAIDRQSKLLAHDGDGEINVLYAAQDAGYEVTALEGFRITPVSHLVIGGAVDVVEYWSGQPSLGQLPEIMKVVTVAQAHARSPPTASVEGFTKSRVAQTPQRRQNASPTVRKHLDARHAESGTSETSRRDPANSAYKGQSDRAADVVRGPNSDPGAVIAETEIPQRSSFYCGVCKMRRGFHVAARLRYCEYRSQW